MRIIFFSVALLLSVTLGVAQTIVSLDSKINLELPSGAVKFADTENLNKMKEAFGEQLAQTLTKNTEVYKLDNIIFRFKVLEKFPSTYIENVNKVFDNSYGRSTSALYSREKQLYKNYQKISKNAGDGKVVYALYDTDDNARVDFHYYNPIKKVVFSLNIEYPKTHKVKVLGAVDRMIETIVVK